MGNWRSDWVAGHFLTPEKTLSSLKIVEQGRIVDLSHTIEMGAPFMAPNQTPYIISSSAAAKNSMKIWEKWRQKNKVGANLERIGMTTHFGRHIDSLVHLFGCIGPRWNRSLQNWTCSDNRGLEESIRYCRNKSAKRGYGLLEYWVGQVFHVK